MANIYEILQSNNIEELKKYLESNFPDKKNINNKDRTLIGDRVVFYMDSVFIEAIIEDADFQDTFYKELEIILNIVKILFEYNPLFDYEMDEDVSNYTKVYKFFCEFLWMYQHSSYINKKKIYEIVVIFHKNKSFMEYVKEAQMDKEGYMFLYPQFYQIKTLFEFSEQIQSLKKQLAEIEEKYTELYYSPNNQGMLNAKEHFIELSNEQEKK